MLRYSLSIQECPIAWPVVPTSYELPTSAPIASTSRVESVALSPAEQAQWLRERYLRALYAEHSVKARRVLSLSADPAQPEARVLDFARDLRGRSPSVSPEVVGAAILPSRRFVEKWQRDAAGLPEDEATLLETALAESTDLGSAAPKGKSTAWRKNGKRELLKSLELVECVGLHESVSDSCSLELQMILLLELMMSSPPSAPVRPAQGSSSPAKGKSSGGSDSDSESESEPGLEDGSEGRVQEHQGDVFADRLHGRVREE